MLIALKALEIVAPVFLLAGAGWVWTKRGLNYDIEFITRMAMAFASPCLIFSVLTSVEIDPATFRSMAIATFAVYGLILAGSILLTLALGLDRRTYLAPLTFANTGNVGLPLCLFAFGEVGLAYGIVLFSIMAALSFTIGIWMVTGGSSPKTTLTQPMFIGSILGVLWAIMDWPVPTVVAKTLELAGQMAIPLMLMTLGVSIAKLTVQGLGKAIALSLIKIGLGIAAGVGVSHLLGLTGPARGVVILQSAMPVAVTSYLLAERFKADGTAVSALVVVSTLVSVAVLPVVLAFLL